MNQKNKIASFLNNLLSHPVQTGIGTLVAIVALIIGIWMYQADQKQRDIEQKQSIANIEYWVMKNSPELTLTSDGQTYSYWVGITNKGPHYGDGVLVTVQNGEAVECSEFTPKANVADIEKPTRFVSDPVHCEYYFDRLYPNYYYFFEINMKVQTGAFWVAVTGGNVKATETHNDAKP